MPPKGSKRAVKASTVAVVNGEDAQQSTLINEPKKRAPARPAKRAAAATDASPVEDEAAQPLIDEPKKKRVARPAKTAAFDDSAPVAEVAAPVLLVEPKKTTSARPAKQVAAKEVPAVEEEAVKVSIAEPKKKATARSAKPAAAKDDIASAAEVTPAVLPEKKSGRVAASKKKPTEVVDGPSDDVIEPVAETKTETKKSRAPAKKKEPVPSKDTNDDEDNKPTVLVSALSPKNGRKKPSSEERTAVPAKRVRSNKKQSDNLDDDQSEVITNRPSKSRAKKIAAEPIAEATEAVVAVVKTGRGAKKPVVAASNDVNADEEPVAVKQAKKTATKKAPAAKAAAPKPKAAPKAATKRSAKVINDSGNNDDDDDSSAPAAVPVNGENGENNEEAVDEDSSAAKSPKATKAATADEALSFDLPADKPYTLKISSWNVAGLRALCRKDGMRFVDLQQPDIFCMQEIKCLGDEVPAEAKVKGYHHYWNSLPGGHAGVALYSRAMPYNVHYGFDYDAAKGKLEPDGRLITAEYTKYFVVCVYVPNSGRKLVTLPDRLRWNERFQAHLAALNEQKPVIVCGDLNVSHQAMDLANPKSNKRSAGFTDEERAGMDDLLGAGFVDTFRQLYPKQTGAYTYWTYMANARTRNIGWRLDYFLTSERLTDKVVDNVICGKVMGSDHCPITLFMNL